MKLLFALLTLFVSLTSSATSGNVRCTEVQQQPKHSISEDQRSLTRQLERHLKRFTHLINESFADLSPEEARQYSLQKASQYSQKIDELVAAGALHPDLVTNVHSQMALLAQTGIMPQLSAQGLAIVYMHYEIIRTHCHNLPEISPI